MYKRVLVPVDKSESSRLAVLEATRIADQQHTTLQLAHVIDLAQFAWGANEFIDIARLQQELKSAGQTLLDELSVFLSSIRYTGPVETALVEIWGGSLAKGILDEASKWSADLIVMGTHGHSGLTHLLLGSVAEGVMRGAEVPILLVRHKHDKNTAE